MLTTTTAVHIAVLGLFLSGCGLVMTEVMLTLQGMMSARMYAFAASFIISWLVLENIVLTSDIITMAEKEKSMLNTSSSSTSPASDGEKEELLRKLTMANKRFNVVSIRLDEETVAHGVTAARLDIVQEKSLSNMHWSLLASKAIALSHIEQMQRREKRRIAAKNRRRMSAESM